MNSHTKLNKFLNDKFILYTSILSFLLGIFYIAIGFNKGFTFWTYSLIAIDFGYIPLALIFNKKAFSPFNLFYALFLVFIIAFNKTYLYNNFTALFVVCIVTMINPKLRIPGFTLYFIVCCIVFTLNEETILHFLIHITRSLWFISIMIYVTTNKYDRKVLILYDDEKKILDQLCHGKIYQKEIEGFSENTVYRKLKNARIRNGNISRDELLTLYKKELATQDKENS